MCATQQWSPWKYWSGETGVATGSPIIVQFAQLIITQRKAYYNIIRASVAHDDYFD